MVTPLGTGNPMVNPMYAKPKTYPDDGRAHLSHPPPVQPHHPSQIHPQMMPHMAQTPHPPTHSQAYHPPTAHTGHPTHPGHTGHPGHGQPMHNPQQSLHELGK